MSEVAPEDLAESRDVTYHGKNHGKDGRDKVIHPLLGGLHKTSAGSADAPVLGDIIVAQTVLGGVDWQRYGFVPAGSAITRNALVGDFGDTVPTYKATLDATLPVIITPAGAGAAGTSLLYSHRDHNHPATDVASKTTLDALVAVVTSHLAREFTFAMTAGQQLTSNSTVFQNITGMAVPLAANEVWRFSMTLISLSSVAADFKFQFTVPAGAVLFLATGGYTAGAVYVPSQASIGAAAPITLDGAAANVATEVYGTVICGGTAGNLQLQAAQAIATIENTDFVVQGTNVFAKKVSV